MRLKVLALDALGLSMTFEPPILAVHTSLQSVTCPVDSPCQLCVQWPRCNATKDTTPWTRHTPTAGKKTTVTAAGRQHGPADYPNFRTTPLLSWRLRPLTPTAYPARLMLGHHATPPFLPVQYLRASRTLRACSDPRYDIAKPAALRLLTAFLTMVTHDSVRFVPVATPFTTKIR